MTLEDFNVIAWRDFLVWSWNKPEMRAVHDSTVRFM